MDFDGGATLNDFITKQANGEETNKNQTEDTEDEEERQRTKFEEWDRGMAWGAMPVVPPMTLDGLEQMGYMDENRAIVNFCVDWKSIVGFLAVAFFQHSFQNSPNEFYAFPMKRGQSMRSLYEAELVWARQLDAFYGSTCNRWPINAQHVYVFSKEI